MKGEEWEVENWVKNKGLLNTIYWYKYDRFIENKK